MNKGKYVPMVGVLGRADMGDGPMTDVYEVYRIRVKPEIRR